VSGLDADNTAEGKTMPSLSEYYPRRFVEVEVDADVEG
jgi:hypothetical protein